MTKSLRDRAAKVGIFWTSDECAQTIDVIKRAERLGIAAAILTLSPFALGGLILAFILHGTK